MKIQLKGDWYMKFVLTVIAVALCWLSIKPLFTAKEVIANPSDNTLYGSVYADVKAAILYSQPIEVRVRNLR